MHGRDKWTPGLHAIGRVEKVDTRLTKDFLLLQQKGAKALGNDSTKLARNVFILHESGKIKSGYRGLVGRIEGDVRHRQGFECLSYTRKGRKIEIEVAHFVFGGGPMASTLYAPLPELPPGRYSVSIRFITCDRVQVDGKVKIVRYPEQKPICSSMACTFEVPEDKNAERKLKRDRENWVAQCLKNFKAIKVGMTRKEVEKRLVRDGGIQGPSLGRFIHPACPHFKIDVEFSVKRNPQDMNRASWSPDDKVTKVSKPYIQLKFLD